MIGVVKRAAELNVGFSIVFRRKRRIYISLTELSLPPLVIFYFWYIRVIGGKLLEGTNDLVYQSIRVNNI